MSNGMATVVEAHDCWWELPRTVVLTVMPLTEHWGHKNCQQWKFYVLTCKLETVGLRTLFLAGNPKILIEAETWKAPKHTIYKVLLHWDKLHITPRSLKKLITIHISFLHSWRHTVQLVRFQKRNKEYSSHIRGSQESQDLIFKPHSPGSSIFLALSESFLKCKYLMGSQSGSGICT